MGLTLNPKTCVVPDQRWGRTMRIRRFGPGDNHPGWGSYRIRLSAGWVRIEIDLQAGSPRSRSMAATWSTKARTFGAMRRFVG